MHHPRLTHACFGGDGIDRHHATAPQHGDRIIEQLLGRLCHAPRVPTKRLVGQVT